VVYSSTMPVCCTRYGSTTLHVRTHQARKMDSWQSKQYSSIFPIMTARSRMQFFQQERISCVCTVYEVRQYTALNATLMLPPCRIWQVSRSWRTIYRAYLRLKHEDQVRWQVVLAGEVTRYPKKYPSFFRIRSSDTWRAAGARLGGGVCV
jgi:hypothetical protein